MYIYIFITYILHSQLLAGRESLLEMYSDDIAELLGFVRGTMMEFPWNFEVPISGQNHCASKLNGLILG
jgi:hypothetical protein